MPTPTVNIIDPAGEAVEIGPGRGDMRHSSVPATVWFSENGRPGSLELLDGKTVSYARLSMEQPRIASAIMRLLTSSVRVPLKVYRRVSEDDRKPLGAGEHPLAAAIQEPWEGAGRAQLVQALLGPLLVHGNGVTGVEEGAVGALRFEDYDWRTLSPIRASQRRIAGWTVHEDGESRDVSADQAVHVAWWSPLGPVGTSPLRQLGTTIRIEQSAQAYQEAYLRQGARPPSGIELPEGIVLDDPTRAALRADLAASYAGSANAGLPALLPGGMKWTSIAHNAHEAELIEQRKVAAEEVAAVYQLPPPMIAQLDKATYANIVTQREMFYTDSLGPPLVLIEQAINSQLVRHLLREEDIYVEFDFAGVLRGDRLKEVQALRESIATGLMTPNEGRRVLNLPASESDGMDDFYIPRNNLEPVGSGGAADPTPQEEPA